MCGRRLKIILSLSALLSSSLFFPLCASLCAEVRLTDEEAQTMMSEIQESKKELATLRNQLSEAETQLTDVNNTWNEQKKSYEEQLNEAEKDKQKLKITASITGGSSIALLVVTVLLIIF